MKRVRQLFFGVFGMILALSSSQVLATVPPQPSNEAERMLLDGRVDEAARVLDAMLARNPTDAAAHLLLCRVRYAQEMPEQAIPECEAATASHSSDSYLWLGRAQGAKAAKSNPLAAFALARKVRTSFETAVRIDGANLPALSDLGEFYVEAPAVVGGGLDKARALAPRLLSQSPRRGHQLLARIAEKAGDHTTAESEFRAAGRSPEALVDLGFFLVEHNRPDEAVPILKAAVDADRDHDAALVDAARTLVAANRAPQLAIRSLRDYLASAAKSDAAPAFKVHLELGDLLSRSGDLAAARREYDAAVNLAPNFAPARNKAAKGASATAERPRHLEKLARRETAVRLCGVFRLSFPCSHELVAHEFGTGVEPSA